MIQIGVGTLAMVDAGGLALLATGIVVLVAAPIGATALLRPGRRRKKHASQRSTWQQVTASASKCVHAPDRSASREVRALLDTERNRDVALRAIAAVCESTDPIGADRLRHIVLESTAAQWLEGELDGRAQDRVVRALELIGQIRLTDRFTASVAVLINDDRADVRRASANALARIDPQLSVSTLPARLATDDPWVADCLADALANLRAMSTDTPSPSLLRHVPNVVIDLRDDGDDVYIAALMSLATCSSEPLRLSSISALSTTDHPAVTTFLFGALQSSDPLARSAAAAGLARHPDGISLLRGVAEDESNPACLSARSVLWTFAEDVSIFDVVPESVTPTPILD